jgi:hypothetical protein
MAPGDSSGQDYAVNSLTIEVGMFLVAGWRVILPLDSRDRRPYPGMVPTRANSPHCDATRE